MRRDNRTLVVALLGLAIAAPVALLLATSPPPAAVADAVQLRDSDWTAEIVVTARSRTSADAVPTRFTIDDAVRSSSLLVADTKMAHYWLGLDRQGRLCLVVGFRGVNAIAVTSCTDASSFEGEGLALQANTIDGAVVAYVIPDAAVGAATNAGLTRAAANLLIGDPFVIARDGAVLSGSAAERSGVELPQFGIPEPF